MTSMLIREEQAARNVARFGQESYPGGVAGDWPDFPNDSQPVMAPVVPRPPRPADWYEQIRAREAMGLDEDSYVPEEPEPPATVTQDTESPGEAYSDPMFDEEFFE